MNLLHILRTPRLNDPRLGELRYSRGNWTSKTAKSFGENGVLLRIPGDRVGVGSKGLELLHGVEHQYSRIKDAALPHFQTHYEPYAQNVDELPHDAAVVIRRIRGPEDLWANVKLVRVWVNAYGKTGDVELAYDTAWDVEHTVGIRVSGGDVIDFCGSV